MPRRADSDDDWQPDSDDDQPLPIAKKKRQVQHPHKVKAMVKPAEKPAAAAAGSRAAQSAGKTGGSTCQARQKRRRVADDDDVWDSEAEEEKDRKEEKKARKKAKPTSGSSSAASSTSAHKVAPKEVAAADKGANAKDQAARIAAQAAAAAAKVAAKAAEAAKAKEHKARATSAKLLEQQQQAEWKASAQARRSKAQAAMKEDGFALHSLDQKADRSTWQALQALLQTSDTSQLGKGKDVTRSYGEYDGLQLASAWCIEHPANVDKYKAAKKRVLQQMETLKKKGALAAGVHMRGMPMATVQRLSSAPTKFGVDAAANESYLLHGTSPGVLLSVLCNGLNERYAGSSAGTAFGDGVYLAEDVAKTDQYGTPDAAYDAASELHRRLYGQTNRHQGSVFYVLVCRALLGYPSRTIETNSAFRPSTNIDTGRRVFEIGVRELAAIPNVTPPFMYHSLIAELGGNLARYRELVLFHGDFVMPEYLLAYHRCFRGQALRVR